LYASISEMERASNLGVVVVLKIKKSDTWNFVLTTAGESLVDRLRDIGTETVLLVHNPCSRVV